MSQGSEGAGPDEVAIRRLADELFIAMDMKG